MPDGFVEACQVNDVEPGGIKLVEVDETLVIVFRNGEEFFCIDDVCTHDGGTLSDGEVNGCQIECPRHGANFDLCTGKALSMPAITDTRLHEVRIEDGRVLVRLNED